MTTYIAVLMQSLALFVQQPHTPKHLKCVQETTTLAVQQAHITTRPYWSAAKSARQARKDFATIRAFCPRNP